MSRAGNSTVWLEFSTPTAFRRAPEVRNYFTSGASDDEAGVLATYLLADPELLARGHSSS